MYFLRRKYVDVCKLPGKVFSLNAGKSIVVIMGFFVLILIKIKYSSETNNEKKKQKKKKP